MPQQKGLSRAERANKAEENARILRDKDRFDRVSKVLKADSARLYKVEQELIREGALKVDDVFFSPRTSKAVMPAIADVGDRARNEDEDDSARTLRIPDGVPPDVLKLSTTPYDRNKSTFNQVPVTVLQTALALCEPIELSKAQQAPLMKRGARVQNQLLLTRIVEMFTGIAGESRIEVADRNNQAVTVIIIRTYNELGKRGSNFNLATLDFETGVGGMFKWQVAGNECIVTNMFSLAECRCNVPRLAEMWIDMNWSEAKAVLRQKNGPFRKPVAAMMLDAATKAGGVSPAAANLAAATKRIARRICCKSSKRLPRSTQTSGGGAGAEDDMKTPPATRRRVASPSSWHDDSAPPCVQGVSVVANGAANSSPNVPRVHGDGAAGKAAGNGVDEEPKSLDTDKKVEHDEAAKKEDEAPAPGESGFVPPPRA